MKIEWKTCFRICTSVFLLFLAMYYWSIISNGIGLFIGALTPIIIGFVIAYVLNILMSFYELHYFPKHSHKPIVRKTRTAVCMVAAILTLLAIITLVIWLVVPELILCIKFLISQLPPLITKILNSQFILKFIPEDTIASLLSFDWQDMISRVANFLALGITTAAETILNIVSSVVSVLVTAFISIIFSVYFMLARDRLKGQSAKLLHHYLPKYETKLIYVFSVLNNSFRKFIVGQCVEAVILWVLCYAGMEIFRFPYAQMISTLIGFTALIPVAGAYIGAIVGALMIMTVSPVKALLFLVFIIVLQQLEGNLIYPKVVGKSIGLPAVWVLVAITLGGSLMGIMGMLIGVPIFAAIYHLIKEDVSMRELKEAELKTAQQKREILKRKQESSDTGEPPST